ncbi:MAG: ribonuclease P protein component [Oscillospiraceae bacterium]
MKFTGSLKKNYEFRRLYSRGNSAATPLLVVYCRKYRRENNRLGITVTGKLGKAVHRNRVRRRIREIYRLNEDRLLRGMDMIIVARVRSRSADYRQLEGAFLDACSKLNLLRDAGNRGSQ